MIIIITLSPLSSLSICLVPRQRQPAGEAVEREGETRAAGVGPTVVGS